MQQCQAFFLAFVLIAFRAGVYWESILEDVILRVDTLAILLWCCTPIFADNSVSIVATANVAQLILVLSGFSSTLALNFAAENVDAQLHKLVFDLVVAALMVTSIRWYVDRLPPFDERDVHSRTGYYTQLLASALYAYHTRCFLSGACSFDVYSFLQWFVACVCVVVCARVCAQQIF